MIGLLDVRRDPSAVISEMTETFARVYLANAHDVLTAIVFVHGVTGATAVRSLLPWVPAAVVPDMLAYAWQAGCALYATFGTAPAVDGDVDAPPASHETLVDMAIANGDEHAIKLTEACLREFALNPSPAYLAAARHAIGVLVAA